MEEMKLSEKKYQYVLMALILVLGLLLFSQMRPYLGGFLGAFTLFVVLRGQMKFLHEKKRFNRTFAAILILVEALFIFLIPVTGIGFLVVDTISGINFNPDLLRDEALRFVDQIEQRFNIEIFTPENLSFIPKLGTNLVQAVASNSYSLVINTMVVVFVLYFMLYSYKSLEAAIREMLPFSKDNKQIFVRETKLIIQANALGIPLLAIVQGTFAYIGYMFLDVNTPLMYAVLTAFASIIPILGSTIVYIPLAINAYFFQDNLTAAIGLILYGVLVIGSVDNVARLFLQKKLADIHPLITVFGVIIGIPMFGFWGVVFGPLLISLFMLFFNMYRLDYIEGSTATPFVSSENRNETNKESRLSVFFKKLTRKNSEETNEEP